MPGILSFSQRKTRPLIISSNGRRSLPKVSAISAITSAPLIATGAWQGVLPLVHMRSKLFGNFLISVPFVNYGGLLYKNDSAAGALLEEAERLRRSLGATHVELRHVGETRKGIPTRQHKVTMILDLAADVDSQWRAFNGWTRNRIRKAEKSGLQFVVVG